MCYSFFSFANTVLLFLATMAYSFNWNKFFLLNSTLYEDMMSV